MITSTTSAERTVRPEAATLPNQPIVRSDAPRPDTLATASADTLRRALTEQPEIRPEVVERARALAADPTYPSQSILQKVAAQILAAPDRSEDQS